MPFLQSHKENAGPAEVFNTYPEVYCHWAQMGEALINGPSPLSPGEREMIQGVVAVTARMTFMSKIIHGHGFIPMSPERAKVNAEHRAKTGYVGLYPKLGKK